MLNTKGGSISKQARIPESPAILPVRVVASTAPLARQTETVAAPGEAWLRTVWGEMIPGTLAVEEGEKADPKADPKAGDKAGEKAGETLVWQTRRLGDLAVKLDEVAGLEFSAVAVEPGPGKAGEDRVLLSNGDALSGFLEALGSTVVVEVGKHERGTLWDLCTLWDFSFAAFRRTLRSSLECLSFFRLAVGRVRQCSCFALSSCGVSCRWRNS